MSLVALKQVSETENINQERKAAAEMQARQLTADAERVGVMLLQSTHDKAVEEGKIMLRQAEMQAEKRAAEIAQSVQADVLAQQKQAEQRLEATADFIIERVVKH